MYAVAQDEQDTTATDATETVAVEEEEPAEEVIVMEAPQTLVAPETDQTFHQRVKEKFIEGGWEFMGAVLLCLIIGLAISIERIITLNLATTNTNSLLA